MFFSKKKKSVGQMPKRMDLPEIRPVNNIAANFSLENLITMLISIACCSALLSYVLIAIEYWYSYS